MKKRIKRIIALVAIGLLGALYLTTLILAILGVSIYNGLFVTCLIGTLGIPILAWIVIWLFDRATMRHAPGDPYQNEETTTDTSDIE